MKGFLLDTNVISELRKAQNKRDINFTAWAERCLPELCWLSVMTVAEIEKGIVMLQRRDRKQAASIRTWFDETLLPLYEGRIIPLSIDIAREAGRLQVPDPKASPDVFIAATALVDNLTIVTRNTEDFVNTGVRMVNPWIKGDITTVLINRPRK